MRILFFIESLESGGKERRFVELVKGLNQCDNIEMELVLTKESIHYTDIFDINIKFHYIIRKKLKKDPRLFLQFCRIVKVYKPDIIHVWGNMAAIYAIPAKLMFRVPMINSEISDAPIRAPKGILSHKLSFPFSDIIISNSKAGLKAYHAPKSKSIVIYNGFDFKRIYNITPVETIKYQFNINTELVIGMVASFSPLKDYSTFIKAALIILETRMDVTFLCVGAGDDEVFQKMVPNKFKSHIKFLGIQKNIESIMNICDIGVLSTYTEGISNSILEFMALAKPIVATDGGGTKELVDHNVTGFLVPQKSPDIISTRLLWLLNNKEEIMRMGHKGRERVQNKYSIDAMVQNTIKVYSKIK